MDENLGSALCTSKENRNGGKLPNKKGESKNIHAERKRRKKLSDRHLMLRSLVPNITNMTKASIMSDAINYIEELKQTVNALTNELCEMGISSEEGPELKRKQKSSPPEEEIKKTNMKAEVHVSQIYKNKFWLKVILEKQNGGLTKLLEAVSAIGFELSDLNVTTQEEAMLVTSCIEGLLDGTVAVDETQKLLLDDIHGRLTK